MASSIISQSKINSSIILISCLIIEIVSIIENEQEFTSMVDLIRLEKLSNNKYHLQKLFISGMIIYKEV